MGEGRLGGREGSLAAVSQHVRPVNDDVATTAGHQTESLLIEVSAGGKRTFNLPASSLIRQ